MPASSRTYELLTALSMTVGRGAVARLACDLAELAAPDRVVDLCCGPGAAVRAAARRGARATGVDPSATMLRLARWISAVRPFGAVAWVEAGAEELPLPDASASVVWALSSLHDWDDPTRGIVEARRILEPGGRLLIVERLVRDGARGHAAHGLTDKGSQEISGELERAAFVDVHREQRRSKNCSLVILQARASTG